LGGRFLVWRRRGDRLDPPNVIECDKYGGGSVMIWGGNSHQGKTELVTVQNSLNAARYCDEIILPIVVPYIQNSNADVFQQDNARCHTAGHTQHVLAENNINTLEWPARSPELSPIEHMWDNLGRMLRYRNDVRDLERALHEE